MRSRTTMAVWALAFAAAGFLAGVVTGFSLVYSSTRDAYHAAGLASGVVRANLSVITILRREVGRIASCTTLDKDRETIRLVSAKTEAVLLVRTAAGYGFCQYP